MRHMTIVLINGIVVHTDVCEHCDDECTGKEYCECEESREMPAHGKV